MKSGRGGKRPGAGRPKSSPTKVVRLSEDTAGKIKDFEVLYAILRQWRSRIDTASPTSPRWQKLRELFLEIDDFL